MLVEFVGGPRDGAKVEMPAPLEPYHKVPFCIPGDPQSGRGRAFRVMVYRLDELPRPCPTYRLVEIV